MELATLLDQNRGIILAKWFERIVATYPRVTSEFLSKQRDPFRNPLGHAIHQSIGPIYDQVRAGMDPKELSRTLDGIIRIRSVQEFTPSEAVSFVFQLKTAIRDVLDSETREPRNWDDLADLESRIDRVALLAFEKYTECREKLHEARNNALKRQTTRFLERANAISAVPHPTREAIDEDDV